MSVRIGFIGAGGIAGMHFDDLEQIDDANVAAICDVVEEAADDAADRFDAEAYYDHEEMYASVGDDLDAVYVCLPPFAHEDQEILGAEHGCDLFVEKPLALSNEKASEILDVVEDNGVIAQVGYNWRYSDGVERALELLDGRTVGYLDGRWWGGVPGGEDHWWRHHDRSGGQTVEQTTHIFDSVRYLGGDVEKVTAYGANRIVDLVDFSDVSSATMHHEDDVVSHVSSSCAAEEGDVGFEVIADGATLSVTQGSIEGTVDGEEIDEEFDSNPYLKEDRAFVEAVQTRDESLVRAPYSDAVDSLAVTLAVNESIETGETVHL